MTTRSYKEFLNAQLRDPGFATTCHELEPEFQVAREVIRLCLEQGLTQKELAELAGTKQSGISRLENASVKPSLGFVQKVAEALGARIEIHLHPVESAEGG